MGDSNKPQYPGEEIHVRREQLAFKAAQLGASRLVIDKLFRQASPDQLDSLESFVRELLLRDELPGGTSMSLDAYVDTLEQLGSEYIGNLSANGLRTVADVHPEQLRESAEHLAGLAQMMRAVPLEYREMMWPTIQHQLHASQYHYGNVERSIVNTGIAAVLDAQGHVVMSNLRYETVPEIDVAFLRNIGDPNPERTMRGMINAANSAPRTILAENSVAQLLQEAEFHFQPPAPGNPDNARPTPKRWTGWGKLFTGAATAGLNITTGVALSVGFGPLAAGASLGGVIASCAVGVGAISEGVGALRGE